MTVFGWDMSHYDSPGIGTAIDEGIAFITHKAGGDQADGDLAAWWSGVRGHRDRILVGAYWVLYPGSPVARADAFLARLDPQCPGWREGPFILQADCEKWGGNSATVPGRADIKAFCDRLVARMPKLRPVVYAPKWTYGDALSGLGYPLWASNYVTGSDGFRALYPGDSSSRWAAYSGQTPAILQYSSSAVIGGQGTSDANAFRGTLAELTNLVAPGWSDDVTGADVWNTDIIPNPAFRPDSSTNPTTTAFFAVGDMWVRTHNAEVSAAAAQSSVVALSAKVDALSAKIGAIGTPDPAALAQAIAAAIPADLAAKVADVLAQRLTA